MKKLHCLMWMSVLVFSLTGCLGGGSSGGGAAAGSPIVPSIPEGTPFISDGAASNVTGGGTLKGDVTDAADAGQTGAGTATLLAQPDGLAIGESLVLEPGSLRLRDKETQAVVATFATKDGGNVRLYEAGNGGLYLVGGNAADDAVVKELKSYLRDSPVLDAGDHPNKDVTNHNYDSDYPGSTLRFTGTVTHAGHTILLNAGAVDLHYSTFGAWALLSDISGTMSNGGASVPWDQKAGINGVNFIADGMESKRADLTGLTTGVTFTGKAVGYAYTNDPSVLNSIGQVAGLGFTPGGGFVHGDVKLTINTSTQASMDLTFKDYYNIAMNNLGLFTSGPGGPGLIGSSAGTIVSVTDQGANAKGYGIDNSSIQNGNLVWGRFYGDAPNNPSEAIGNFNVESKTGGITGAYGVKKQ